MKKYLLFLFLFFLIAFKSNAQAYHPIFLDSGKWNIVSSYEDFTYPIPTWISATQTISLYQHDSIYKTKRYRLVDEDLMREDTSTKKIYVLKDTVEKLLYDFTLNKGDSFYFDAEYIPNTPPYKGWRKVDTTYFVNTLQGLRKVISVGDLGGWIEGVGSIYRPNYPKAIWTNLGPNTVSGGSLLCSWINGKQVYQAANTSTCNFSSGIENLQLQNSILIFPNPTSSSFTIKKSSAENLQFHLYNLIGQNVLNENLKNETTQIERNGLPANAYLFSITNLEGKIVQTGKIVFE